MNDLIAHDMQFKYAGIDIYTNIDDIPWVSSPNAECDLPFAVTRDVLLDVEVYKSFLTNSISRFRQSKYYKAYKSYLMGLGLDKCAIMGNVDENMATIEMHHNFLTIHDIALMITEHVINTIGSITTFDLIQLLINEHWNNRIPIVMLSETLHEMYHADNGNFIPPNATFGKWWELIYEYRFGITIDIAKKIVRYIDAYQNTPVGNMFVSVRSDILGFAHYNEYGYPANRCVVLNNIGNNHIELFGGVA